jgi:kynurenine formamidase
MKTPGAVWITLFLFSPMLAESAGPDLEHSRIIDLTHAYNAQTIYWPTDTSGFRLQQLHHGPTDAGFFYAANAFCTAEHGGTHLDAPVHFAEGRSSVEQIPLERLFAPAVVIDIAAKTSGDPDYLLTPDDVLAFEKQHGVIEAGTIVLLRTGWGRYWPDRKKYMGDDTPGDTTRLHFPSYGEASARLLVEARQVAALGVDTASIDYGQSRDFLVHRLAGAHDVPGLENLDRLDELPARGAHVIALPMKIEGGTGGPVRIIALVPEH